MNAHPFLLPASRIELTRQPIQTSRLSLRPVASHDAAALWRILSNEHEREQLGRWLSWVHWTRELSDSENFVRGSIDDWDGRRAYRLAITLHGEVVGMIGLEQLLFTQRQAELGYWLRSGAQGRGLAAEAAAAVLSWAFVDLNAHRVRAAVAVGNDRSEKLLRTLRFQYEGCARHAEWCGGKWLDHKLFGLLEEEFLA